MSDSQDDLVISLPRRCLVVLAGAAGSGKTTFAHRLFRRSQVVSSDRCRELVSDDSANQRASPQAFELMHFWLAKRMELSRFCVADATHATHDSRRRVLDVARAHNYPAYLIVLDAPAEVCRQRDLLRFKRRVGPEVIAQQLEKLPREPERFLAEGFEQVWLLTPEQADRARIQFAGQQRQL